MSGKLFTLVVLIFIGLAFAMFMFIDSFDSNLSEATGLVVSGESFPTYVETHPAISSLPKSASIGVKIGSNVYEIDGRDIHDVDSLADDNDVVVTLPEGYESVIGELGLCDAVRKANGENNLNVEIFSSKTKLFLKYGRLLKYGECLK